MINVIVTVLWGCLLVYHYQWVEHAKQGSYSCQQKEHAEQVVTVLQGVCWSIANFGWNRVITMLCVLCAGQHWIDGAEQGYYNVVCRVVCVGWIMLNRVITVLRVLCAGYHQQ